MMRVRFCDYRDNTSGEAEVSVVEASEMLVDEKLGFGRFELIEPVETQTVELSYRGKNWQVTFNGMSISIRDMDEKQTVDFSYLE